MFVVLGIMFVGVGLGYVFRRIEALQMLNKLIFPTICLLLTVLGLSVGSNELIMKNLGTLGVQAFLLSFAATGGSVMAGWCVYRWFFKKKL